MDLTYSTYLHLDQLLGLQQPRSLSPRRPALRKRGPAFRLGFRSLSRPALATFNQYGLPS